MAYPATIEVQTPPKIANWRPLVQWLLAIPHFIVSYVLMIVAEVCGVIAWFAILFTGKMPQGLANMICLAIRYQSRTSAYAGFLHDQYPPFDFTTTAAEPGGTPVQVNLQPMLEGRNRLTCALRLLWAIPAILFLIVISIVAGICQFLAFFAVLFTGKWPEGLRGWVLKGMRVSLRFSAYCFLLTDVYPPFSAD